MLFYINLILNKYEFLNYHINLCIYKFHIRLLTYKGFYNKCDKLLQLVREVVLNNQFYINLCPISVSYKTIKDQNFIIYEYSSYHFEKQNKIY